MKKVLILLALAFSFPATSQVSEEIVVPRLVVGITIDQMRADMIARYWSGFGKDGFKRLVRKGAWMIDTRFQYVPTYTGPGHASIYTGASPSGHGIVANDWYDETTGELIYCVQDTTTQQFGGLSGAVGRSPKNLVSTTIADELERFTAGRSKTIGISLKDRGAILPIGRTGDNAYWFDPSTGHFVSSSWYSKGLPNWVREFNAEKRPELYLSKPWELKYPKGRYENHMLDANAFEHAIGGADRPAFPYDLPGLFAQTKDLNLLTYTPLGNKLVTDMAINCILHEELGIDETTDLLAISYSSTDKLGHATGPRSMELEDMYYRLDEEIARLLVELDELVGEDRYLLFITSDHGVVDIPAYLTQLKSSAGYVRKDNLETTVEKAIEAKYGPGPWIKAHMNYQMYFDMNKVAEVGADPAKVRSIAQQALFTNRDIAEVVTADQLLGQEFSRGPRAKMQEGYMRIRSGDVLYSLKPGYLLENEGDERKGTTHGSGHTYDTQVPLLFFGYGIPEMQVARTVHIEDIAPTIAMWCGFALPDACRGNAIHEVFVEE